MAGGRREEPGPFPLEHLPVDQDSQFHQLMPRINHFNQPRTEEIILFRLASVVFHRQTKILRFLMKSYKPLQEMARKAAAI